MRSRWILVSGIAFLFALFGLLALLGVLPEQLLGRLDNMSSVGGLFVSVVSLLVAAVSLQQAQTQPAAATTRADVMTDLARSVSRQWESEVAVRRINDPHPLPVSWTNAPEHLFRGWESIQAASRSGTGSAIDGAGGSSSRDLSGEDRQLAQVLTHRVPTHRLVVLGEPGAGKTVLLIRLVLDLLQSRAPTGRVPVLASLASWNPVEQGLAEWLAEVLTTANPSLRRQAPHDRSRRSWAEVLLSEHLLIPVLDGLDEVPESGRTRAVDRINDWLALSMENHVVLSSRLTEYEAMLHAAGPVRPITRLAGAAGILLEALEPEPVRRYLERDAGDGPVATQRWAPVVDQLGEPSPIGSAFRTPLMVGLARTIYNPRSDEPAPADPGELRRFNDVDELERHLFDGFLPAAYRSQSDPRETRRWSLSDAERWLAYLARPPGRGTGDDSTTDRSRAHVDLAWWRLHERVSPWVLGTAAAVVPSLAVGIAAAVRHSLGSGLGIGLILGVSTAALISRHREAARPVLGIAVGAACAVAGAVLGGMIGGPLDLGRGSTGGLVGAIGVGLGVGPIGGMLGAFAGGLLGGVGVGLTAGEAPGLPAGILCGLGAGAASAATFIRASRRTPALGLRSSRLSLRPALAAGAVAGVALGVPGGALAGTMGAVAGFCLGLLTPDADLRVATSPLVALRRDRATFLTFGFASGATVFAGASLAVASVVGAAGGVTVGLVFGCLQAAWGRYTIARIWLAARRKLPWRLMSFLADAHTRGVLRQVGAQYQFRHAELQRHLARRA